jgi:hypothetical protein
MVNVLGFCYDAETKTEVAWQEAEIVCGRVPHILHPIHRCSGQAVGTRHQTQLPLRAQTNANILHASVCS